MRFFYLVRRRVGYRNDFGKWFDSLIMECKYWDIFFCNVREIDIVEKVNMYKYWCCLKGICCEYLFFYKYLRLCFEKNLNDKVINEIIVEIFKCEGNF